MADRSNVVSIESARRRRGGRAPQSDVAVSIASAPGVVWVTVGTRADGAELWLMPKEALSMAEDLRKAGRRAHAKGNPR